MRERKRHFLERIPTNWKEHVVKVEGMVNNYIEKIQTTISWFSEMFTKERENNIKYFFSTLDSASELITAVGKFFKCKPIL